MRDQLTSRLNEATSAVSDGYDDLAARVNEAGHDLGETVSDNYQQFATRFGDVTKTVADGYGQTSDRVLDFVVDANRKVVEAAVSSADQVVEQLPEVPWADRLPTPAEAGDRYLEFVDQVVSVNRDFNHRMVRLLEEDIAARATAQSGATTKSTSTKSTAKKSGAKKSGAKKSTARKRSAKPAAASA